MKRIARVVAVRALALCTALLVATLWLLVACGPIVKIVKPAKLHFVTIVHSTSTGTDRVRIRWAAQGVYMGSETRTVAPGLDATVIMGEEAPDLVEIDSTALSVAYGPPDWQGHSVWVISYPNGDAHGEF